MARKVIGPAIHGMTRKLFPQRMVPASKLPPLAVAGRREHRDKTYKYLSCYANEKGLEVHVIEEMNGLASLPEFEDYAPLEVICPWHEARERIQNAFSVIEPAVFLQPPAEGESFSPPQNGTGAYPCDEGYGCCPKGSLLGTLHSR